ncbi:MAG: FAD-binding oxidoreductase, partial [Acidobacteria bacterium]|nr:FAD-binding oxidoreductase [Acidobacteriota bacterium]
HKQFLPLFTPYMVQSTIGGTLASGVDSPLRQAYGTARDYLLGIEYIDGSGLRTKSGGRVVKNVAGYDIHKVHLGALGSLGIITRVNFRTFPSPVEGSHGFVASFANPEGAFELRHRIVDSPLTPLTLEVLSPELCRLFCTRNASSLGEPLASAEKWFPAGHSAVTAAFVGNPQVIARYERDLKCMAEECKASTTAVLGDADRPAVWGRLREALPLLRESSPAATLFRIPALPGKFCALIKSLCAAAEKAHVPSAYVVRSVGFVYFGLLPESSNSDSLSRLADVCGEIFKIAQQHEGHAVVMWCPTELKRRMNVWGTPRGDLELMKKVKQTFDPHGIFSPGRFAGGM